MRNLDLDYHEIEVCAGRLSLVARLVTTSGGFRCDSGHVEVALEVPGINAILYASPAQSEREHASA